MRYTEEDRRGLINRLKDTRDPMERDRILWALAGQEEASQRKFPVSPTPPRPPAGRTMPEQRSASGNMPDLRNISRVAADVKRVVGFIIPGALILIGLVNILQALLRFAATRRIEMEIPHFVTGGIFVFFGLAGVLRALRNGTEKGGSIRADLPPGKRRLS